MAFVDLLLLIGSLFILAMVVIKPNFFWEGKGMRRRREMIGDKNTAVLYIITAVVMLAVGLWGALG